MTGTLSPEDYAQQQQIIRQQRMADMLMSQNQQPQGQMVSGRYVAPNIFQQLQPVANMLTGAYLAKQGDTQQQKLAEAIRGRNATELQDILSKQFGSADYKPAVPYPTKPVISEGSDMVDNQKVVMPSVYNQIGQAPDPKAAFMAASQSRSPQGQALFQTLLAQKLNPKIHNVAQGASLLQETPEGGIKPLYINPEKPEKPPVSYQEYQLAKQEGFKGSYNDYQTLDANRKRAVTNVTTNVMGGEKQYDKTFGEEVAKQDIALKATAENAPNTLANIKRQQDLLEKGGVITGVGANQRLDIARLGQSLGLTGKNVVADTQQFYAGRAGSVLDSIKSSGLGAGNGFTNKDLEFLEKAKLGGIVFDPESLRRQLKIEDNVTRAIVGRYNQRVKDMPIAGGLKLNPINVEGGVTYLGPVK